LDTEDILVYGGLLYLYFTTTGGGVSYSGGPVPNPNPVPVSNNPPGVVPTGSNTGTGTVTNPALIPAQSSINQQIIQFNNDIGAGASVAVAGVGILASLSVLPVAVAGPIGAAIAGVVVLVRSLVSHAHLYASSLVQNYENPFGQGVIAVIQKITDELNAGTLTLEDATNARDAVVGAWVLYQGVMHEIQSQGTDWYIVATQSLNNLDNQYLGETLPNGKTLGVGMGGAYGDQPNYGFMSSWIDWLNQRVTSLGGV
jgi:hypothetical protein